VAGDPSGDSSDDSSGEDDVFEDNPDRNPTAAATANSNENIGENAGESAYVRYLREEGQRIEQLLAVKLAETPPPPPPALQSPEYYPTLAGQTGRGHFHPDNLENDYRGWGSNSTTDEPVIVLPTPPALPETITIASTTASEGSTIADNIESEPEVARNLSSTSSDGSVKILADVLFRGRGTDDNVEPEPEAARKLSSTSLDGSVKILPQPTTPNRVVGTAHPILRPDLNRPEPENTWDWDSLPPPIPYIPNIPTTI
jgi:hypothetical protein